MTKGRTSVWTQKLITSEKLLELMLIAPEESDVHNIALALKMGRAHTIFIQPTFFEKMIKLAIKKDNLACFQEILNTETLASHRCLPDIIKNRDVCFKAMRKQRMSHFEFVVDILSNNGDSYISHLSNLLAHACNMGLIQAVRILMERGINPSNVQIYLLARHHFRAGKYRYLSSRENYAQIIQIIGMYGIDPVACDRLESDVVDVVNLVKNLTKNCY